jgi:hypothetical protein
MLDREVVEEFLNYRFEGSDWEIPEDIPKSVLVETFCLYTEDDLGEWLKDNFKSFFDHGAPNWDWIRGRVEYYKQ